MPSKNTFEGFFSLVTYKALKVLYMLYWYLSDDLLYQPKFFEKCLVVTNAMEISEQALVAKSVKQTFEPWI
jgi:hypothetical protein